MATVQPISQVAPDHLHTKDDKSTLPVEYLEELRSRYQIPADVELRVPAVKKRFSDARSMEFTLYEETQWRGLRLPLPQLVVNVLNRLEVAPGQLMRNLWKILFTCAIAWPRATGGERMMVDEFFSYYKAPG